MTTAIKSWYIRYTAELAKTNINTMAEYSAGGKVNERNSSSIRPHYVDELIQMSISGKECMYEKSEKESIEDRMAFLRFSGYGDRGCRSCAAGASDNALPSAGVLLSGKRL